MKAQTNTAGRIGSMPAWFEWCPVTWIKGVGGKLQSPAIRHGIYPDGDPEYIENIGACHHIEIQTRPGTVAILFDDLDSGTWVECDITPADARRVARLLVEAADRLEPEVVDVFTEGTKGEHIYQITRSVLESILAGQDVDLPAWIVERIKAKHGAGKGAA